ncbi:MAG: HEAT repeat domain-containing protein [Acidobacteria bacterium]|nr:HEAT repeat domain-containing protein [Acidobacteriota bacterium]
MGIKDFLDNQREKKEERRIERLTRRLCERYSQSGERLAAAEELAAHDTPAAIYGLLQRFNVQTPQIIEDEEEKKFVYDRIRATGEAAIGPLLRHINERENLAFPLRLLKEIAGAERTRDILLEILSDFTPEYDRVPEKKIDIIQALGEYKDPQIIQVLLPFLNDPQDDVVLAAIDTLAGHPESEDEIRVAFIELLLDEEEKPRVKRHVLEILKDLRWRVAGYRKRVEEVITDPYYLDKKGYIKQQGEV